MKKITALLVAATVVATMVPSIASAAGPSAVVVQGRLGC